MTRLSPDGDAVLANARQHAIVLSGLVIAHDDAVNTIGWKPAESVGSGTNSGAAWCGGTGTDSLIKQGSVICDMRQSDGGGRFVCNTTESTLWFDWGGSCSTVKAMCAAEQQAGAALTAAWIDLIYPRLCPAHANLRRPGKWSPIQRAPNHAARFAGARWPCIVGLMPDNRWPLRRLLPAQPQNAASGWRKSGFPVIFQLFSK